MLQMSHTVLSEMGGTELALLSERIVEAADGGMIAAEQIQEWVGSWFTDNELPPPEPPETAA